MTYLDRVVDAYLDAVAWTEEESTPGVQFAREVFTQARRECATFLAEADTLTEGLSAEQVGHDFWLTRNRHGAGFWDRGLGPVGDALTTLAHKAGGRDVYVGDDGFAYFSPEA